MWTAQTPPQLSSIRERLIRLEETIIFALIERAQFPRNPPVYIADAILSGPPSFLHFFLAETENLHARVRRYLSPEENAFTRELPASSLPPLPPSTSIMPNDITVCDEIYQSTSTRSCLPSVRLETTATMAPAPPATSPFFRP